MSLETVICFTQALSTDDQIRTSDRLVSFCLQMIDEIHLLKAHERNKIRWKIFTTGKTSNCYSRF